MASDPHELSDTLAAMRSEFAKFSDCGLEMNTEGVGVMVALLTELGLQAQAIENEVQRLRWNAAARGLATRGGTGDEGGWEDREARALAAASEPGSNVTLFPVVARPPFGDGPW
jgi:hypothetical protein